MAIWWSCILLFYLPESISADFFEQKTWTVVDVMNDVYTDVALLYHRPNTPCSECAVRTNMLHGIAFSCHHGNRSCLIHSICHVEIPPSPGTWESRDGMRHFCSIQVTTYDGDAWHDVSLHVTGRNAILFAVKTAQDAYLGLRSADLSASSGYWVVLGGWYNGKSCLRDGFVVGSTCFSEHQGSVLSEAEYTTFWITWEFGRIRVGLGETSGNCTIMDHTYSNVYSINYISLKSQHSPKAEWIIFL
ncbi:uncharacterized protein LOC125680079 [Ostrea edulis]|uniref:uncharacterized protein LOC125680079 n=1 Tax=Ostrea edulis TaxID=37623 RepID=UPI0024AF8E71|nr:uncharacterized protein LOC125680079 [Ostrea edulis]